MAIQINPAFIPAASGRPASRRKQSASGELPPPPKQKAHINYIPAPESLRTVIASALESLRSGVAWDRGSIVNLLI